MLYVKIVLKIDIVYVGILKNMYLNLLNLNRFEGTKNQAENGQIWIHWFKQMPNGSWNIKKEREPKKDFKGRAYIRYNYSTPKFNIISSCQIMMWGGKLNCTL